MSFLFKKIKRTKKSEIETSKIQIIGIGQGGANILNYMRIHGFKEASFALCDMNADVIEVSNVEEKLLLGEKGFGAGNNPEVAKKEANKNIRSIRSMIKHDVAILFVVACLGGGCGTGVSPIIARESKKLGIKTIGVVTLPFDFEGSSRCSQALAGLKDLAVNTDAMFVFNNQYFLDHHEDLTVTMAFSKADELMCNIIRNIANNHCYAESN